MLRTVHCSRGVLVQPRPYGTDHSAMLDALRAGEFPLRGVALFDDALTDTQFEELHHHGVRGARVHLPLENTEAVLARLPAIAERVRRFGWHLQFYLNAERNPDVDRVLLQLPVPLVIDHFGLVPAAGGTSRRAVFQTLLRLARSGRCYGSNSPRPTGFHSSRPSLPMSRRSRVPCSRPRPIIACGEPTGRTPTSPSCPMMETSWTCSPTGRRTKPRGTSSSWKIRQPSMASRRHASEPFPLSTRHDPPYHRALFFSSPDWP